MVEVWFVELTWRTYNGRVREVVETTRTYRLTDEMEARRVAKQYVAMVGSRFVRVSLYGPAPLVTTVIMEEINNG